MAATEKVSALGNILRRLSVLFAYLGGAVISAIGIMSAVSIIGRTIVSKPILGDFELVEIGTAIAGTLFLSYCQITGGHIFVDIFTLRTSERARHWLDRMGCLFMALMFFVVGWRAIVGAIAIRENSEVSMLMGVPIWLGYAGMLPGVFLAAITALAKAFGVYIPEKAADE
jgi:TRAP-type C4-dicarboxylate transport system permease small subunit